MVAVVVLWPVPLMVMEAIKRKRPFPVGWLLKVLSMTALVSEVQEVREV